MREKVTFPTNVPTAVILEGIGTEQTNKAGDPEFRYFLRGEQIMWVPPEVHDAIQQARGNNGTELIITKNQQRRGAPIRWTVEQIADEPAAAAELRNTTTAPSSRAPIPPTPTPAPRPTPTPATNNGHRQPAPRPQPTPAPPQEVWYHDEAEQPLTGADKLAGCLAAAIDAAAEASIYAERKGLPLRFDAGDIRAMAATLMISEQRTGRL